MTDLPSNDDITYIAGEPGGTWTDAVKQAAFDFQKEGIGAAPATKLTISSGVIIPTRAAHVVDTEAAAATDDLTNILNTNIADGRWIRLRPANTARVVTVKHAAGGDGQIYLAGNADYVMSGSDSVIILERNGDFWMEVWSSRVAKGTTVSVSTADTTQGTLSEKVGVSGLVSKAIANPGAAESLILSVPVATQAEAEAGTATDRAMTPLRTAQSVAARLYSQFRNLLINTDFLNPANQRLYVSGSNTTYANSFTIDRWFAVTSGQAASWSGGVLIAPAGGITQVIEGALIPRSGTYVVSWTGTATCTVNGTGVAKGGTVTLTAGTNAAVSFFGGTVQSPQIEYGTAPTAFEVIPYDVVLRRCMRYYQKLQDIPAMAVSASAVAVGFPLPVPMRAAPLATVDAPMGFRYASGGNVFQSSASVGSNYSTNTTLRLEVIPNFNGLTGGQFGILANSVAALTPIILSAEITS